MTKYIQYIQCLSSRRNWPPPTPSPASECVPPPPLRTRRGGTQSPGGEGVGRSLFERQEKKPSTLSTLLSTALGRTVQGCLLVQMTAFASRRGRGGGQHPVLRTRNLLVLKYGGDWKAHVYFSTVYKLFFLNTYKHKRA